MAPGAHGHELLGMVVVDGVEEVVVGVQVLPQRVLEIGLLLRPDAHGKGRRILLDCWQLGLDGEGDKPVGDEFGKEIGHEEGGRGVGFIVAVYIYRLR
jgi:hypothetical protein